MGYFDYLLSLIKNYAFLFSFLMKRNQIIKARHIIQTASNGCISLVYKFIKSYNVHKVCKVYQVYQVTSLSSICQYNQVSF